MIGSRKPLVLAAVALLSATLGTASAFAQEPPPASAPPPPVGGSLGVFGERGQFVVSSDLNLSLIRSSTSMGGGSATVFDLTPSLDYFVSTNFSVGALVQFKYTTATGDYSRTDISIGARAGYNIVLTNVLTLWVRGGLAYSHASEEIMGQSGSGNTVTLQVFAPVLWHPAPHFFIGAGPMLATDLMATIEGTDVGKITSFGIASTVGGYWGGL